jgi:Domain of unknown function (DUF4157)
MQKYIVPRAPEIQSPMQVPAPMPIVADQLGVPQISTSPRIAQLQNYAAIANGAHTPSHPVKGGLPMQLQAGIESLSGIAMHDVRVHYNSSKPAQLQAHAYAQGTDIHLAPGQEKHLPHEAWHVVQQKQDRVKPTLQLKGVAINDDSALEREADVMGARAMAGASLQFVRPLSSVVSGASATQRAVAQRVLFANVRSGQNAELKQKSFDDLETKGWNDHTAMLAEYLASDAKAVFESTEETGPGKDKVSAAVEKALDNINITGAAIAAAFLPLMKMQNLWHDAGAGVIAAMRSEFEDKLDIIEAAKENEAARLSIEDVWAADATPNTEDLEGYEVDFDKILSKHLLKEIIDAEKVGDLPDFKAESLNGLMGYLLYEELRENYYAAAPVAAAAAAAPTKPFLQLIDEINDGTITKLDYVSKYATATDWGAEFTVALPAPRAVYYAGKAVVHTHYTAMANQPSYGHTKPAALKFAKGFGFTKVKLAKLLAMDDTKKTYNAL